MSISYLIQEGSLSKALSKIQATCQRVGVSEIENGSVDEDCYISFLIVNVKNPKTESKMTYKFGGRQQSKYHRLFLCRELYKGRSFYIITPTEIETSELLTKGGQVIGKMYLMYEPRKISTIHNIPVFISRNAILPIDRTSKKVKVTPIHKDVMTNKAQDIFTFMIKSTNLLLKRIELRPTCGTLFCDGRHTNSIKCPAIGTMEQQPLMCMETEVTVPDANIDDITFRSTELARLFIEDDALKNAHNQKTLRNSIKRQLEEYKSNTVKFYVAGWYKKTAEGEKGPTHISCIWPQKLIDYPKYAGEMEEEIEVSPYKAGVNMPNMTATLDSDSDNETEDTQHHQEPPRRKRRFIVNDPGEGSSQMTADQHVYSLQENYAVGRKKTVRFSSHDSTLEVTEALTPSPYTSIELELPNITGTLDSGDEQPNEERDKASKREKKRTNIGALGNTKRAGSSEASEETEVLTTSPLASAELEADHGEVALEHEQ